MNLVKLKVMTSDETPQAIDVWVNTDHIKAVEINSGNAFIVIQHGVTAYKSAESPNDTLGRLL